MTQQHLTSRFKQGTKHRRRIALHLDQLQSEPQLPSVLDQEDLMAFLVISQNYQMLDCTCTSTLAPSQTGKLPLHPASIVTELMFMRIDNYLRMKWSGK